MTQYKYLRGSQDSREAVEFDITRRGQYITTCVVDVDLLISGLKAFPCGNGDDVKLTAQQRLAILELVQAERKRITDSYPVKTYEGWQASGGSRGLYRSPRPLERATAARGTGNATTASRRSTWDSSASRTTWKFA